MRFRTWVAPRDPEAEAFENYVPKFGFCWWYWIPTFFHQRPVICGNFHNARELRIIWLCFVINLSIGKEGV